ncbi:MAG: hypothetical protein HY683_10700 [Chloroflexi bacterium]|nr:hypothetical protein [Chloroflexota bacterium]
MMAGRRQTGPPDEGFLIPALSAIFGWLKGLSLGEYLAKRTRTDADRYRVVEVYVLSWLALEAVLFLYLALALPRGGTLGFGVVAALVSILMGYRYLDISQAVLNGVLFDRVRGEATGTSLERSLVLTVANYLESGLIFTALAYLAGSAFFPPLKSAAGALFYSFGMAVRFNPPAVAVGAWSQLLLVAQVVITLTLLLVLVARTVMVLLAPRGR